MMSGSGNVPPYAQGSGFSSGSQTPFWNSGGGFGDMMGGGFNPNMFSGGLQSLLGGLFGHSGAPAGDAMKQFQQWMQKAQGVQNPFLQAGTGAIGDYQKWLSGMQDPSKFINNLMGQYQQSPYSQYLQKQSMNAGINAASMGGLPGGQGGAGVGSTPFAQQMQQNSANIASGDMNQWLQNVLGVNSTYGEGEAGLMGMGANAANSLSGMYGQMGNNMGGMAYNQGASQNNDFWNAIGGGASILGSFL